MINPLVMPELGSMEKGALMASPTASLRPPGLRSAVGTRIDRFSSILFPSAFALFNVCYWYYYLSKANG